MAVRDCLDHFLAESFSEFNHPLLMAGWTEVPALARKCQKILMSTVSTFHTSKAIVQETAKSGLNEVATVISSGSDIACKPCWRGV